MPSCVQEKGILKADWPGHLGAGLWCGVSWPFSCESPILASFSLSFGEKVVTCGKGLLTSCLKVKLPAFWSRGAWGAVGSPVDSIGTPLVCVWYPPSDISRILPAQRPFFAFFKDWCSPDVPGGSWLRIHLPMQRTWVRALVGELGSHRQGN